jgi:hypothetical protein
MSLDKTFKHLLGALLVTLAVSATPSQADDTLTGDARYSGFYWGSYCSITATDGVWGFVFSDNYAFGSCAYVRNWLATATPAPVAQWQAGRYRLNGPNKVQARCGIFNEWFYGTGAFPLQRAYNWARFTGGRHCLFLSY